MNQASSNIPLDAYVSTLPTDSLDLLLNPLVAHSPFLDKLYVSARLEFHDTKHVTATIDGSCPLVALNPDYIPASRQDIVLLKDVAAGQYRGLSLISGGLFLTAAQAGRRSLLALRRDAHAPASPLCITEPAGRMDKSLDSVCLDEANEELLIVVTQNHEGKKHVSVVIFKDPSAAKGPWIKTKSALLQLRYPEFFNGDTEISYRHAYLDDGIPWWSNLPETCLTVNTPFFKTLSTGYVWHDVVNNTLEFRRFAEISLQEGETLSFKDGEPFNREPVLVPMDTGTRAFLLNGYGPMTPILGHLASLSS